MSTDLPLELGLWEKRDVGWAKVAIFDLEQGVRSVEFAPRFNRPGAWSLSLPWSKQPRPVTKRHLVTCDFRNSRETGVIEHFGAESADDGSPDLTLSGLTALTWLSDALGWPSPGRAIDDQVSVRDYREGPAETVLRRFIIDNLVTRLGYDITIPPSLGRGDTVTLNSEFTNVLEIVSEKATLGGLGVRMGLVNTTSKTRARMQLEFYVPEDRSRRQHLSSDIGNLVAWSQSDTVPTATRAIVQKAKERQSRQILSVSLANNTITTAGERKTKNREVESVNVAGNSITTKSSHEMPTGSRIQITGGTPPAPLVRDTDYYAIKVDSNTIRVALTKAAANNGNNITLTNNGSGQIVVTKVTIRPVKHKLRTGDIITFSGGTPPEPLDTDVDYHAVRVDENSFSVAMTRADALNGLIVDLVDQFEGDVSITESTRSYRQVARTNPEETWGRKREVLVVGNSEDKPAGLDEQGRDALRDGAAQHAFELETTEVPGMRYGDPIGLGDWVTIKLPIFDSITGEPETRVDQIGGVRMTVSESDGLVVQMIPGDPDATNPELQQASDIRRIRRRVRAARED